MQINISERLKIIASLVRRNVILADIGTDHAFLPIYLLQKNIISGAIAVDINKGPLEIAQTHIKNEGLTDKVKTFISDGLEELSPDSADDIVIAGMGGELIASILERCKWVKNQRYHIILQPMTRPEALRKFLFRNGFSIFEEKTVCEANKLYTIMSVYFTGETANFSDSDIYIGKLGNKNDEASRLFLRKTLKSLSFSHRGALAENDGCRAQKIRNICSDICDLTGDDIDDYCKNDL